MNREKNFKLTIEYDGTNYCGFQRQKNRPTIQSQIEKAVRKVCHQHVAIVSSGRTDSGVHAKRHIVSFKLNTRLSCANLLNGLNSHLPRDIAVLKVDRVPMSFHAQYSAKRKIYRYEVYTASVMSPLKRLYAYHYPYELSLTDMRASAEYVIGTHDFRSFAAKNKKKENTLRTIKSIRIMKKGSSVFFTFEGDGFLYNMVRVLVGTLLQIGRGKICPQEIATILASQRRDLAGPTVPGHGLVLLRVIY